MVCFIDTKRILHGLKKVNEFTLRFLNRSFGESVVEVEVSNLKQTSTENISLAQKTTEMLNFISTNGPHPLVYIKIGFFLNTYFSKNWHFTIKLSQFYISQSVDAHFKATKTLPNFGSLCISMPYFHDLSVIYF